MSAWASIFGDGAGGLVGGAPPAPIPPPVDPFDSVMLDSFVLHEGMSVGDLAGTLVGVPPGWWAVEMLGDSIDSGQLVFEDGTDRLLVGPAGAGQENEPYSDLSVRLAQIVDYDPLVALSVSPTSVLPGDVFTIQISLQDAPEWLQDGDDISVDWQVVGHGSNPATGDAFIGGVLPSGTLGFRVSNFQRQASVQVATAPASLSPQYGWQVVISNPSGCEIVGPASISGVIEAAGESDNFGPVVVTPPAISGSAQVGATWTATAGTYAGIPSPVVVSQGWERRQDLGGDTFGPVEAITGATALTYTVPASLEGWQIRFRQTVEGHAGPLDAVSEWSVTLAEAATQVRFGARTPAEWGAVPVAEADGVYGPFTVAGGLLAPNGAPMTEPSYTVGDVTVTVVPDAVSVATQAELSALADWPSTNPGAARIEFRSNAFTWPSSRNWSAFRNRGDGVLWTHDQGDVLLPEGDARLPVFGGGTGVGSFAGSGQVRDWTFRNIARHRPVDESVQGGTGFTLLSPSLRFTVEDCYCDMGELPAYLGGRAQHRTWISIDRNATDATVRRNIFRRGRRAQFRGRGTHMYENLFDHASEDFIFLSGLEPSPSGRKPMFVNNHATALVGIGSTYHQDNIHAHNAGNGALGGVVQDAIVGGNSFDPGPIWMRVGAIDQDFIKSSNTIVGDTQLTGAPDEHNRFSTHIGNVASGVPATITLPPVAQSATLRYSFRRSTGHPSGPVILQNAPGDLASPGFPLTLTGNFAVDIHCDGSSWVLEPPDGPTLFHSGVVWWPYESVEMPVNARRRRVLVDVRGLAEPPVITLPPGTDSSIVYVVRMGAPSDPSVLVRAPAGQTLAGSTDDVVLSEPCHTVRFARASAATDYTWSRYTSGVQGIFSNQMRWRNCHIAFNISYGDLPNMLSLESEPGQTTQSYIYNNLTFRSPTDTGPNQVFTNQHSFCNITRAFGHSDRPGTWANNFPIPAGAATPGAVFVGASVPPEEGTWWRPDAGGNADPYQSLLTREQMIARFATVAESYLTTDQIGPICGLWDFTGLGGMTGTPVPTRLRSAQPEDGDQFVKPLGPFQFAFTRPVFFASGTITCLDPNDNVIWQVNTAAPPEWATRPAPHLLRIDPEVAAPEGAACRIVATSGAMTGLFEEAVDLGIFDFETASGPWTGSLSPLQWSSPAWSDRGGSEAKRTENIVSDDGWIRLTDPMRLETNNNPPSLRWNNSNTPGYRAPRDADGTLTLAFKVRRRPGTGGGQLQVDFNLGNSMLGRLRISSSGTFTQNTLPGAAAATSIPLDANEVPDPVNGDGPQNGWIVLMTFGPYGGTNQRVMLDFSGGGNVEIKKFGIIPGDHVSAISVSG